jgi:hypothetical protein
MSGRFKAATLDLLAITSRPTRTILRARVENSGKNRFPAKWCKLVEILYGGGNADWLPSTTREAGISPKIPAFNKLLLCAVQRRRVLAAIGEDAKTSEAEEHHRPGRWQGSGGAKRCHKPGHVSIRSLPSLKVSSRHKPAHVVIEIAGT